MKSVHFAVRTGSLNKTKPSQSVNWGRPCLLAIPAFDRIAGLNNRYLNYNKGVCLR